MLPILVLMIVFRSVLVPLKAALMNLLSIAAAFLTLFAPPRVPRPSYRDSSEVGSSVSVSPSAPDSISTTSDQRMWYVETSAYGITCTSGRFRPLRKTFSFTPFVRMSTF